MRLLIFCAIAFCTGASAAPNECDKVFAEMRSDRLPPSQPQIPFTQSQRAIPQDLPGTQVQLVIPIDRLPPTLRPEVRSAGQNPLLSDSAPLGSGPHSNTPLIDSVARLPRTAAGGTYAGSNTPYGHGLTDHDVSLVLEHVMPGFGTPFDRFGFSANLRDYTPHSGGEATVMVPQTGRHILRFYRLDPAKRDLMQLEKRAIETARAAGVSGLALPVVDREEFIDGRPYRVQAFEKYEGTLANLFETNFFSTLPYHKRAELAAGLTKTVKELHAAGLHHYDIKAANILYRVKADGKIELALSDTGFMSNPNRVDPSRSPFGTSYYMAPTMLNSLFKDPRTDLYPLGIVLAELETGETIYSAATGRNGGHSGQGGGLTPTTQTLAGNALRSGAASSGSPLRLHSTFGSPGASNQTRLAYPYTRPKEANLSPAEKTARKNLVLVAGYPWRKAEEAHEAAEMARQEPEAFERWFFEKAFAENAPAESSYNWNHNGSHLVRTILSNEVLAERVVANAAKLPPATRARMLAQLKLVNQAVKEAEKTGGSGSGEVGGYHVEVDPHSTLPQLRLTLTDKEFAYRVFPRFLNGYDLERLIAALGR